MADDVDASDHEKDLISSGPTQLSGPSPEGRRPEGWLPNQSASIPTSTVGLFHRSSANTLNNSTANAANRDVWNLHGRLSHWALFKMGPHIRWHLIPPAAIPGLDSAYPDQTAFDAESDDPEDIQIEYGDFEITLLDNLDINTTHQPGAWYRSPDLPNGLSLDGIYIRKLYPKGYGYPCPYPCPEGPPVRIGDVGELTSTGFTALLNLAECQLPSLHSELEALAFRGLS
ncbi:hypothetical protein BKA70DRAFT_1452007 [Coprinopsis sp. MPI-PUGE-AT-0042]|nr:hypothetical protein BKA70DRAFT_1452007 [Coprinopsis sp. MPI-PUGE-AT-0042]